MRQDGAPVPEFDEEIRSFYERYPEAERLD